MKKLLVVDGNSIINRAFYGIRPLTTSYGQHTNAIYGMVNILLKHIESIKPDFCAVAFDLREPTFRHKMYSEYKAGRRAMPEELASQFDYAKKCCEMLGFTVVSVKGFEADDILGTYAKMAEDSGDVAAHIVTGDRDSLQLINKNTTVFLETNSGTVRFDRDKFVEVYGIEPNQFVDVKALMGDGSDNIPGVSGIGEKTAIKLVSEFGTLDRIFENYQESSLGKAVKAKLEVGRDNAYMSKDLATIVQNVPCEIDIFNLGDGIMDRESALELFEKLEFSGFIKRFALDTETTDSSVEKVKIESIEIGENELNGITEEEIYLDYDVQNGFFILSGDKLFKYSGKIDSLINFLNEHIIVCYDCKHIYKIFAELGCNWRGCNLDVMLAAYVVNSGDSSFSMERLVMEYAGSIIDDNVPRVVYIKKISDLLRNAVANSGQNSLLYEIEMPLAAVLCDMELAGFKINKEGIESYGRTLETLARELAERIYFYAGGEFNINSPKQLGTVLFERLGLPCSKKTKSGYSTSADVLEKLKNYPIVEDILDYRKVTKLKGTYTDGLQKVADTNNRVHTNFKQTGTATGRLSSTEPNLQNIPIRTDLGRELRRFFVPENENYVIIDADYSQIELRLLANISDDKNMIDAFLSGEDIHTSTASAVFGVHLDAVTSEHRKRAKAVNFGIMYGIGEYSLSQDLGISVAQAKRYIESYLASYPEIDAYLKDTIQQAYKDGYVTTIFGRRRYISELKAQNRNLKSFGERVAMNSPIQGSAADIIKIAMINVSRKLKECNIDARLILQVHDELLIEANKNCAAEAFEILKTEMENAVSLKVPLDVDIHIGENWFECK